MKNPLLVLTVCAWLAACAASPARATLDTVQDPPAQTITTVPTALLLGPPSPKLGPMLGPLAPETIEGDLIATAPIGPAGPLPGALRPSPFSTQDVSTPRIWPTAVPSNKLAGPSTPLVPLPSRFSGPPAPRPVPIPYGPPVPADGLPTAFGFVWPVGGEDSFQDPDEDGRPGFRVVRDFNPYGSGSRKHMGVDLSNRQSGSTVRALGDGIVALVADRSSGDAMHSGWGNLIVLSHRLPGGEVVYSLLAHLKDRSIRVRPGDRVTAGQAIAQVGATGHADGPHLHLEMRRFLGWNLLDVLPRGWQHMGFVNPLNFLANHLAGFPDLPQGHWAYKFVMPLVRTGVVQPSAEFAPDQVMTVSEFATLLARAFGPNVTTLGAGAPEQPVQLAQALGSLQRALSSPTAAAASASLLDSPRSSIVLRSTLENAVGHSITDPGHRLTRAEAAVLVKAALGASNREPEPLTLGR